MLNQEQVLLPELQLLCGTDLSVFANSGDSTQSFTTDMAQLISILHEHNQFDAPSLDVFVGLHALSGIGELVDAGDSGVITFDDLGQCVRAISDLEALGILLAQLDSPGFAMWCGSHASRARSLLNSLRQRIDSRLQYLRSLSTNIDVIAAANQLAVNALRHQIRQASIIGVPVRTVQLLWSKSVSAAKLNKWSSQLTKAGAGTVIARSGGSPRELTSDVTRGFSRGRTLKPGSLIELSESEYLYVLALKRVGSLDLNVGIVENYAVIEYRGVRRYLALPAACSRMHAHNVTLSSEHISIYFTVKEELWPKTAINRT